MSKRPFVTATDVAKRKVEDEYNKALGFREGLERAAQLHDQKVKDLHSVLKFAQGRDVGGDTVVASIQDVVGMHENSAKAIRALVSQVDKMQRELVANS